MHQVGLKIVRRKVEIPTWWIKVAREMIRRDTIVNNGQYSWKPMMDGYYTMWW